MTEFAFEGGYRGHGGDLSDFVDYKAARDAGEIEALGATPIPRQSRTPFPNMPAPTDDDNFRRMLDGQSPYSPYDFGPYEGELLAKVKVFRTSAPAGYCGVIHDNGHKGMLAQIDDQWGGGTYKLERPGALGQLGHLSTILVTGPSKPILRTVEPVEPSAPLPPELQELDEDSAVTPEPVAAPPPITVGCLVWLELGKGGPYKVVAKYNHALGASVAAHHPNSAKNEYERVRVPADHFWLCQDAVGQVHILAGGSLTTVEPSSALKGVTQRLVAAGNWAWARRELVLWGSLAAAGAKLLGAV